MSKTSRELRSLNITPDDVDDHQRQYDLINKVGMIGAGHKIIELEKQIQTIEVRLKSLEQSARDTCEFELTAQSIEKHTNNAGQTPKNVRIAQVDREAAQVGAQVGSVCGSSKETRHTESPVERELGESRPTDVTTKIRKTYPINTFRGATQDELVGYVKAVVIGVIDELESFAEDHTVAGDGDRSVHVKYLQIMKERYMR